MLSFVLLLVCAGVGAAVNDVSEGDFPDVVHKHKCMIFWVVQDHCDRCSLLYHSFLTAAQSFRYEKELFFGRVSDQALAHAFEVTEFPSLVYYEYGSVVPRVYLGDITSKTVAKVVADAMRRDSRKVDQTFALDLTLDIYDVVIGTRDQFRLIMLHEANDDDNVAAYDELAETFDNEPTVVIAKINVDFEKKLKRNFNAIAYPSFYWFKKGSDTKLRYGGDLNVDHMIAFINKEAGLFRTKGGRLNPYAGLIPEFDEILNAHGRDLHEIRNFDTIRMKLTRAWKSLPTHVDHELIEFYYEMLANMEEDRTIETLDEARNRLYRQMPDVGPLGFDALIRKRNIVQKFIDIIGTHLLEQLSHGDFGAPIRGFEDVNNKAKLKQFEHDIEFHEEL